MKPKADLHDFSEEEKHSQKKRLSDRLIKDYDIINQCKVKVSIRSNLKAKIILQEPVNTLYMGMKSITK